MKYPATASNGEFSQTGIKPSTQTTIHFGAGPPDPSLPEPQPMSPAVYQRIETNIKNTQARVRYLESGVKELRAKIPGTTVTVKMGAVPPGLPSEFGEFKTFTPEGFTRFIEVESVNLQALKKELAALQASSTGTPSELEKIKILKAKILNKAVLLDYWRGIRQVLESNIKPLSTLLRDKETNLLSERKMLEALKDLKAKRICPISTAAAIKARVGRVPLLTIAALGLAFPTIVSAAKQKNWVGVGYSVFGTIVGAPSPVELANDEELARIYRQEVAFRELLNGDLAQRLGPYGIDDREFWGNFETICSRPQQAIQERGENLYQEYLEWKAKQSPSTAPQ